MARRLGDSHNSLNHLATPLPGHLVILTRPRRRISTEQGPAGDRQAIVGYLSLTHGAEKPVMLTPEETLALPAALGLAALGGAAMGKSP
jgi:hypothetical protein